MHPNVHSNTIHKKTRHANNLNVHQQMNGYRRWVIYTMEYYSAIKKKEIMPFAATWMDLDMTKLSEVKSEREKYYVISLTYRI